MKKELAPIVRQIMPTWLMGVCDPDIAVSNAAKTGLNDLFQEKKRSDAILYCAEKILEVINIYSIFYYTLNYIDIFN